VQEFIPARQFVPAKPVKRRKGWTTGKVIALVLICSILSGVIGAGALGLVHHYLHPQQNQNGMQQTPQTPGTNQGDNSAGIQQGDRDDVTIDTDRVDTSKLMTAAEVYAQNVNSTVGIKAYSGTYGGSTGSGFILSDNGYIITNHHVIEGATQITVSFYNGESAPAVLIGSDASNDIAVLRVAREGLTPVILGKSSQLLVGDTVLAIGNPLGDLTFSLTSGVVSALQRTITFSDGTSMSLIQTDCAINSGNSGGALFNLYGEVVGITNAKYSGNSSSGASIDNIGFAIPIDTAKRIALSIIEKGFVSTPYVGITVIDVTEQMQNYGLPAGAAIQEITAGGPADQAGLKVNDIVTHIGTHKITSGAQLKQIVVNSQVGDVLKFKVYRQGQIVTIMVTVGEQVKPAS
jgi:serine protease Do